MNHLIFNLNLFITIVSHVLYTQKKTNA